MTTTHVNLVAVLSEQSALIITQIVCRFKFEVAHYRGSSRLEPREGRPSIAWGGSPRWYPMEKTKPRRATDTWCYPARSPLRGLRMFVGIDSWGFRPRLYSVAPAGAKNEIRSLIAQVQKIPADSIHFTPGTPILRNAVRNDSRSSGFTARIGSRLGPPVRPHNSRAALTPGPSAPVVVQNLP